MSTVNSTQHYRGHVISVTVDDVILPNGRQAALEVVHHPGGAAVVAINDLQQVCLLRQYRYVAGGWIWELPAGKIEAGEEALAGAKRELAEETGYHAKKWRPLVEYFASPGFLGESMKVFLAEGLEPGAAPARTRRRTASSNCWAGSSTRSANAAYDSAEMIRPFAAATSARGPGRAMSTISAPSLAS